VTFSGNLYLARVLKHNLFTLQLSADEAMDGIAQLSLTLANADSALSQIQWETGWKGTQLTVYFVFADLATGAVTTESTILFRGIAGDPDEIAEDTMKLSFANKLSLLRVGLPGIRIQRLCPWNFPTTSKQRQEAMTGDQYSRYFRCGYSADAPGGIGNMNDSQPFAVCDHTRSACEQRGMFNKDSHGNATRRFGGFEFVPSSTLVRGHGQKPAQQAVILDNTAKYNDYVPMVYGVGWLAAPVILARNDGNLTHMELLLGAGTIDSVLKVVVNDIEIPLGVSGIDMTATGWYNIVTAGAVQGSFNLDFVDSNNQPVGDPYGSVAVLSVVVPNRISTGGSLPHVEVLMRGLHLDRYNSDASFRDTVFTNNPAWVILDILRRAGWAPGDINLASFANAAAYCDELISTTDINGNAIHIARYGCNLILTKRRSAADVIRSVRVACGLMLRYGANGLLELLPETSLELQHPTLPDGSNSIESLNGGWPVYEFSDGSATASGIARNPDGSSTVRLVSKSISESSNQVTVEFQDEANEYQQDTLSVVSDDDQALIGYEVGNLSTALGLPNFNQALRVLSRQIGKATKGNRFIEFGTSFRALKVRPGDIIAVTYLKEGLVRAPFRVVKLAPSINYRNVAILAQAHDDSWYTDDPGNGSGGGRQPVASVGLPRPLLGPAFSSDGATQFNIAESTTARTDGGATTILTVGFVKPAQPLTSAPIAPLLSLAPQISTSTGSLRGGINYYYALTASDAAGNEGPLSFTIRAAIPEGSDTNSIGLTGLSLPSTASSFNVYRGTSPQLLYRIASSQPIADIFTDSGLAPQPLGPPDASFDHANFYYRLEIAGPMIANVFSSTTIGNFDMNAANSAYAGKLARIVAGSGAGQERRITFNDESTLMVSPAWSIAPDGTSSFVVVESTWQFGAIGTVSPVQFEVPNQRGGVVQISGRGVNSNGIEGSPELCPVTRWVVGGGAGSELDLDVPGPPTYALAATGQGAVTLSQVGFTSLTNTRSVTAGTLQLIYFDELQTPTPYKLGNSVDAATSAIAIASPFAENPGMLQIGEELMTVQSFDSTTNTCTVTRGALGSASSNHNANDPVWLLSKATFVLPFARDFFENPAAQNFAHTIPVPDIRIAASEFYVTNSRGDSATSVQCYTSSPDGGLRTCSGGQFAIQVGGYLAVQQNAAPPLFVEATHSVRDLRASVSEAPAGTAILLNLLRNSTVYCQLAIPAGQTVSNVFNGATLAPLKEGDAVTLDIVQVGQAQQNSPGRDLTVTIRL
jgi:hypothetical protein